jgi:hypothetical protein
MSDIPDISKMYQMASVASALDHPALGGTSFGGSREQVIATAHVVAATRDLRTCLASDTSGLKQVMSSIDRKNAAAKEFTRQTGISWPL